MTNSLQLTYRAIFTGLVLADCWSTPVPSPHSQIVETGFPDWPNVWLNLAQTHGLSRIDPTAGQINWPALEAQTPTGALLATVPWLLLQVDRYAHSRALVQDWSHQQGFSLATRAAIDVLFSWLCRGLFPSSYPPPCLQPVSWLELSRLATIDQDQGEIVAEGTPMSDMALYPTIAPNPVTPSAQCLPRVLGDLELAAKTVLASSGQYGLALLTSRSLGMTSPVTALIGLLASVDSGLSGLPLAWRSLYLSERLAISYYPNRWRIRDESHLWALADGVFYRWAGVMPSVQADSDLVFATYG